MEKLDKDTLQKNTIQYITLQICAPNSWWAHRHCDYFSPKKVYWCMSRCPINKCWEDICCSFCADLSNAAGAEWKTEHIQYVADLLNWWLHFESGGLEMGGCSACVCVLV